MNQVKKKCYGQGGELQYLKTDDEANWNSNFTAGVQVDPQRNRDSFCLK